MKRKYYKELWSLRFQKMLELEQRGVAAYQAMFDRVRAKHKGHALEPHLERMIAEEKQHVAMVGELIRILEEQP